MVCAYLDPGSGSAIVGAVAAGFAGAAVAAKAVLFKFWTGRKKKPSAPDENVDTEDVDTVEEQSEPSPSVGGDPSDTQWGGADV